MPTLLIALPLISAFLTAYGIAYIVKPKALASRYLSIDGLRGQLALLVFAHHAYVWHQYLATGRWEAPQSSFYNQVGEISVIMFFGVTGFLFSSKLINDRHRGTDWDRLFLSRVLRLCPMYFASIALLVVVALSFGGKAVPDDFVGYVKDIGHWLFFTIVKMPDLNGHARTFIINAGVTWTLRYEWFFYGLLPLGALLIGRRPPILYLILAGIVLAGVWLLHVNLSYFVPFLSGFVAAMAVKSELFCRIARRRISSILILGILILLVQRYHGAYGAVQVVLLTLVFCLFAGGNSLFGILERRPAILLGEITYSVYLLHGLFLYMLMGSGLLLPSPQSLSPLGYWLLISVASACIVIVSYFTYSYIEVPFIAMVPRVLGRLRAGELASVDRMGGSSQQNTGVRATGDATESGTRR
jgi:peptidoglycan/LPS O-acetylase OafA/YrhL